MTPPCTPTAARTSKRIRELKEVATARTAGLEVAKPDAMDADDEGNELAIARRATHNGDNKATGGPVVGMAIDIQDTCLVWSPGRVIQIKNQAGEDINKKTVVVVRYDGWEHKWDEMIDWDGPRLARLYTYTRRVKCFCSIFPKIKGKPKKEELIDLPEKAPQIYSRAWPCSVQFRMPHPTAPQRTSADQLSAKDQLGLEPKAHVIPYATHLLPLFLQKLTKKEGGRWYDCNLLVPWTETPEYLGVTQQGFDEAFAVAKADKTIIGTLPPNVLARGSLLKDEYLVKQEGGNGRFDGALGEKSSKASLKDDDKYLEKDGGIADLDSDDEPLTKIRKTSTPITTKNVTPRQVKDKDKEETLVRMEQLASIICKHRHSKTNDPTEATDAGTMQGDLGEFPIDDRKTSARATPSKGQLSITSPPSQATSTTEEPKERIILSSPVKITEPLFPGVVKCKRSQMWLASVASGGNGEIILGTFPTQCQAKQAIEVATGYASAEVENDEATSVILDNAAVSLEHVIEAFERQPERSQFSLHDWTMQHIGHVLEGNALELTGSINSTAVPRASKRKSYPRKLDLASGQYLG